MTSGGRITAVRTGSSPQARVHLASPDAQGSTDDVASARVTDAEATAKWRTPARWTGGTRGGALLNILWPVLLSESTTRRASWCTPHVSTLVCDGRTGPPALPVGAPGQCVLSTLVVDGSIASVSSAAVLDGGWLVPGR